MAKRSRKKLKQTKSAKAARKYYRKHKAKILAKRKRARKAHKSGSGKKKKKSGGGKKKKKKSGKKKSKRSRNKNPFAFLGGFMAGLPGGGRQRKRYGMRAVDRLNRMRARNHYAASPLDIN